VSQDPELRATEAAIARTRERLAGRLTELRGEISGLTDWHTWVARKPLTFVAGALALGFLLGLRGDDR